MTKNEQTFFYILNGHRDVIGLTDSNGQIVASYTYDAWGNILSQSGPMANENPYRYAGYRYDNETSLYYLMARYYNAEDGVFLSGDPLAGDLSQPQTQNGYNYANNNPVMNYDPTGHYAQIILGAVVGGLLGAMQYLLNLVNKYGVKNYKKKIIKTDLFWAMGRGAAAGALGIGVVKYLSNKATLTYVGEKLLSLHLAPAAYAIAGYGDYSARGLSEATFLSLFNNKNNAIYVSIAAKIKEIYKKYR